MAKILNIYMRHFYIYTPLRYIPHYDYLVYMPLNDNSVIYMPHKYKCPIVFYSYINYNRTYIYMFWDHKLVCVCLFKSISMEVLKRFVETRDIKFISVKLYTAIALRQSVTVGRQENRLFIGQVYKFWSTDWRNCIKLYLADNLY